MSKEVSTVITLMDKKMLGLAANGKSAEEISEETGVDPESVLLRVKELIGSRNVWDNVERENLLLQSIYDLKAKLEKNFEAVMGDPKLIENYRKTLEFLGQRLEARSKINEADLMRVSEAHARKMIGLINAGYYHARSRLASEYPEVDLSVIDAAFNDGMGDAVAALEAEVSDG